MAYKAKVLELAAGGSNAALTASNGGVVYSTASAMAILAGTATANQVLVSGSNSAPSWSTATFPATAGATGTILRSDGTNWVATTATYPATTTINQLIYSSAANALSGLATANNGTLVTSSAGVPSILAGPGTTGNVLQSNAAAAPSFSTATYPSTTTINQVLYSSAANTIGGITASNNGVLISSATGVPSWLAAGTTGQVLSATTGSPPSWSANGAGDVTGPGSSTDNALVRFDGTTGKLIQNGVITEDDTGNLSISAAVSGASLSSTVANTSNTASATAFYNAQVAGSTASDAYYKAEISGGQAWTLGLDNSDSDAFVISATATPGTTNVMRVASTGEINYPLQSAFLATLGTNDSNVTGNGATYTLGSGNALTEIFDQNSDFVTTGTFTAPVTGRYSLAMNFVMSDITAAMTFQGSSIVTSNRTYQFGFQNDAAVATVAVVPGVISTGGSVLADMDAADTYTATIAISGGAGNTADTLVSGARIFMCGNLAC